MDGDENVGRTTPSDTRSSRIPLFRSCSGQEALVRLM